VQHKVGYLQHVAEIHQDIEHTETADLLTEPPPPPPQVRTRLRRTATTAKIPLTHPAPTVCWRTTTIQDFFPLTREHSKKMIAKNPLPNGQALSQAYSHGTAGDERIP